MLRPAVPELVLSLAQPDPSTGGGSSPRRARRALWGVAPLAMSPDLWPEGSKRRHLVRAATLTSVMGLAWASTTTGLVAPTARSKETADGEVAVAGEDVPLAMNFVRYLSGTDDEHDAIEAVTEGRETVEVAAAPAAADPPAPAPDPEAWRSHVLAEHDGIAIHQPAADVPLVGFHEAAAVGAAAVEPIAEPDEQHGRAPVPHGGEDDDLDTLVLPTRDRASAPSTAIDVAVPAGEVVHAPITGTVTAVDPYLLYGQHPDTRIVIQPEGRPDVELVVLHVTGHDVAVGDRVEAGVTPIAASSTPFPFESQIDRFTEAEIGRATPHVHLELRQRS